MELDDGKGTRPTDGIAYVSGNELVLRLPKSAASMRVLGVTLSASPDGTEYDDQLIDF